MNLDGAEPSEDRSPRRRGRRQVVQIAVSAALITVVFVAVLPEVADFDQVWAAIRGMTSIELLSLGLAGAWNLATGWLVPMASLPGLSLTRAMFLVQSSTAVANTVPAGSAVAVGLSASMLRSWGFRRSIVTLSLLVTGIWDNLTKLALPAAALTGLLIEGEDSEPLVAVALLGAVVLVAAVILFALMLRSEQAAAQIGVVSGRAASFLLRLFRQPPATGWDIATTRFRSKTIGLLRARWLALTAASLLSHLSLYLVLLLALRHVGASEDDVGWAEVLAVFAFVRLLSAIPLTPGGLGVVELALTAGLVGAGGPRAEVVAAILVYRGLTYLVPIPFGALTYVGWRRTLNRRALDRPEVALQDQHGSG